MCLAKAGTGFAVWTHADKKKLRSFSRGKGLVWIRSLIFNVVFYVAITVQMIVFLPVLVLPRAWGIHIVYNWAKSSVWLLKVICGTKVEIRGRENIPEGSAVIASKHQSTLETFALVPLVTNFAFILKHELQWLPFFGWYTIKFRMIGVRRGERGRAVRNLVAAVRNAITESDRHIVIFPEGTRRAPNAPPHYKKGIAAIYSEVGLPCVPVALNSGLFWPRREFIRYPGTITIEILPPIQPGLSREVFLKTLQEQIETASDRLLAEAREQYPWVDQNGTKQEH